MQRDERQFVTGCSFLRKDQGTTTDIDLFASSAIGQALAAAATGCRMVLFPQLLSAINDGIVCLHIVIAIILLR